MSPVRVEAGKNIRNAVEKIIIGTITCLLIYPYGYYIMMTD